MKNKKLNPEEDFYLNEDGYIVLTESFLLKRGFCCDNNCLNCPYQKKIKLKSKKE